MTPRERLEHLATELEQFSEKLTPHFDMYVWGESITDESSVEDLVYGCGTAACAAGFACLLPKLKADGILFREDGPIYLDKTSDESLEEFFGLNDEQMYYIFMPGSYEYGEYSKILPEHVVAHIREVLEGVR